MGMILAWWWIVACFSKLYFATVCLRITRGTCKNADSWALSWTVEVWTSGLGWGGDQESTGFSRSPSESLAHLKSEHCFIKMKSLVIGINCWMWFRKKVCRSDGRWCVFFILVLPSFPDVRTQDNSRFNYGIRVLGNVSLKLVCAHWHLILRSISGSWWIRWNPFMLLAFQEPFIWRDYFKGRKGSENSKWIEKKHDRYI